MKVRTFYRLSVWLPLLLPLAAAALFGDQPGAIGSLLYISFFFGGLPYALLAIWATWWIGGRPEEDIRILMFMMPLVMLGAYVLFIAVIGAVNGKGDKALSMISIGAAVIIPLGFAYVGLVAALRWMLKKFI
ncbi:MAG: hypothetical protein EPO35_11245, partial [Acidobacteria bacterium]